MEAQDRADRLSGTSKLLIGKGGGPNSAARFRQVLVKIGLCHGFQIVSYIHQPTIKQVRGKHRIEIWTGSVESGLTEELEGELTVMHYLDDRAVSYTHLRAHETDSDLVCRL